VQSEWDTSSSIVAIDGSPTGDGTRVARRRARHAGPQWRADARTEKQVGGEYDHRHGTADQQRGDDRLRSSHKPKHTLGWNPS